MALVFLSVLPSCAETIRVRAENIGFSPARIEAHPGDTVEWTNADFVAHTATARNGSFDVTIMPGRVATIVTAAGPVDYYCRYHPNMTGQIKVSND